MAEDKNEIPKAIAEGFFQLRLAARTLRKLSGEKKNQALESLADRVLAETQNLLRANKEDLARLPQDTASAFRDRLTLDEKRIAQMVESLRQVAKLTDPVNEVVEERSLPNGLRLKRVRSPFGVIFMIFESRPNVVLEAFSLAFKAGNAIALRGGSESKSTAQALYSLMHEVMRENGIKPSPFFGMNDYDRGLVEKLLQQKAWIDVVVPRGGDRLIDFVEKTAVMPIIKNDRGLCHAYVDEDADLAMAVNIVANAKTQRPGVCNSLETVLVHEKVASRFLPDLYKTTSATGLAFRADSESQRHLPKAENVTAAQPKDWDTEHLDLILNVAIVKSLDHAIEHIESHGSRHSETIITTSEEKARLFQAEIDAAAVYWNASTRFTDGFEFGLGGELGISTQKLHVRGPVGLRELTTPRWIIDGNGQIRE